MSDRPSGWLLRRFGSFVRPVIRRAGDRVHLPLLSVTKDGGVLPQADTNKRSIASADLSNYQVVKRGEFALAPMALYYGAIGRLQRVGEGLISPAYEAFDLDSTVDSSFFLFLIRQPRMVALYNALSQGGNLDGKRKSTSLATFCEISRPLPPLDEQRAIAAILGQVERRCALSRQVIERLESSQSAVMADLFRSLSRSKGHGKLRPLAGLVRIVSGGTPAMSEPANWGPDIPWVCPRDMKAPIIERTVLSVTPQGAGGLRAVGSESVLIVVRGMILARAVPVARPAGKVVFNQDMRALVPSGELDPAFLHCFLKTKETFLLRAVTRSTHGTCRLTLDDVSELQIPLPRLDEQERIGALGTRFDTRLTKERTTLRQLEHLQSALSQALLTGRKRCSPELIARLNDLSSSTPTPEVAHASA